MNTEENRFGNNPVIVIVGFIASMIAIFGFMTGYNNIKQLTEQSTTTASSTNGPDTPIPTLTASPIALTSSTSTQIPFDPSNTVLNWEFDSFGDIGGWGAHDYDLRGLYAVSVDNGLLIYRVIIGSSFMYNRNLKIDADSVNTIQILMRVSGGRDAVLYFGTDNDPDTGENGKDFTFLVKPGSDFILYQIQTHHNPKWNGYITELRLDNTGPSDVEIDFIRLLR